MNDLPAGQGVWLTLVLVAIVVVRFLLRELRVRRMRLNRIFILPAVFALLVVFLVVTTLVQDPSQQTNLIVGSLAAVLVGAAVGFAVAHFTGVERADVPGTVLVRGSMVTVAIWIGALLLRIVPRFVLGSVPHTPGTTAMLNAVLLVLLAVAITVVRLQIVRRARGLPA